MEIVNNLEQSVHDIQSFFKKNDIPFLPVRKKGKKYLIDFTLNVKSYVSKSLMADTFHFELELKKSRKSLQFSIYTKEGSQMPYHPHFQILDKLSFSTLLTKQAIWIDYLNEQGDIVSFVKRVILSLQWNKGYINLETSKIGNKEAEQWFLKEDYKKTDKFPTDIFLKKPIKVNSTPNPVNKEPIAQSKTHYKKFAVEDSPSNKKKFTINDQTVYNLETKPISDFNFEIDEKLNSVIHSNSKTRLFISVKAKKQIWEHIKWSNLQTPSNKNEQGGILLGQVYFDSSNSIQFGVVEQVVYGESARGNSVYLEMNHETWSQMLNDADVIIDNEKDSNIQVIGWYHTHPNNLDVFMSGTDMNTQQRFFNQSWHYAIVLNPHKQIWKAFFGIEARDCQGFILKDKESNNYTEELYKPSKEEKYFPKKKDLIILLLIIALVSTIAFVFFQNRKTLINEQKMKNEKKIVKSIDKSIFLFSSTGDTIDISKSLQFKLSNKSNFDNQLFVKKADVSYNIDSTKIGILSQLYLKDSIYSEFGNLRDTLSLSSKEILIDSLGWIGFNFKGLIQSKDE